MAKQLFRLGAIAIALVLIGCMGRQHKGPELVVDAFEDGEGCRILVNGETVTAERLLEIASAWPSRRGLVRMKRNTPYRCVGGVVFTLQRAGFLKVGTVVEERVQ